MSPKPGRTGGTRIRSDADTAGRAADSAGRGVGSTVGSAIGSITGRAVGSTAGHTAGSAGQPSAGGAGRAVQPKAHTAGSTSQPDGGTPKSGEFQVIAALQAQFEAVAGRAAPTSDLWIGDDAALVRDSAGAPLLLATDLVVAGVHVDLDLCSLADLGFKAIMVTVSDLAAMGARPDYLLVSVAAPPVPTSNCWPRAWPKRQRRPVPSWSEATCPPLPSSWSRLP